MKNKIAFALAAVLSLAGCCKDGNLSPEGTEDKNKVTITATLPATKVHMKDEKIAVRVSWEASDVIRICSMDGKRFGTFSPDSSGLGTNVDTFTGTSDLEEGDTCYAYAPANTATLSPNLAKQEGALEYCMKNAIMFSSGTYLGDSTTMHFSNLLSIIAIDIFFPDSLAESIGSEFAIDRIEVNNAVTSGSFEFTDGEWGWKLPEKDDKFTTVSVGKTLAAGGSTRVYMLIFPQYVEGGLTFNIIGTTNEGKSQTFTVTTGVDYDGVISNLRFSMGYLYMADIVLGEPSTFGGYSVVSDLATLGDKGQKTVWHTGDSLVMYTTVNGNKVVRSFYAMKPGGSWSYFEGSIYGLENVTDDNKWLAVYNQSGRGKLDYADQDGTLECAQQRLYMAAKATGRNPEFDFSKKVNKKTGNGQLSVIIKIDKNKIDKKYKYIQVQTGGAWKIKDTTITAPRTNSDYVNTINFRENSERYLYFAIPALDYSLEGIIVTCFTRNPDGAYKGYDVYQDRAGMTSVGVVFERDYSNSGGQIVDLKVGKPSDGSWKMSVANPGTQGYVDLKGYGKWAPHAVGSFWIDGDTREFERAYEMAAIPFAWGMILPSTKGSLSQTNKERFEQYSQYDLVGEGGYLDMYDFTWDTYLCAEDELRTDSDPILKWAKNCSERYFNTSDVYVDIAGSRYDAARVHWGLGWRLPRYNYDNEDDLGSDYDMFHDLVRKYVWSEDEHTFTMQLDETTLKWIMSPLYRDGLMDNWYNDFRTERNCKTLFFWMSDSWLEWMPITWDFMTNTKDPDLIFLHTYFNDSVPRYWGIPIYPVYDPPVHD